MKEPIPIQVPCCAPLTAGVLDEATAVELAGVLKALADPVRLRLVSLVAAAPGGEICACDLPALLDRSQPTVSHHLTLLVRAGLIAREQRGKWAWFRTRDEGFATLRAVLAGSGDPASDLGSGDGDAGGSAAAPSSAATAAAVG